ncbi:hypothetical protein J6590_047903, partial [Homalodisca vitripennis]
SSIFPDTFRSGKTTGRPQTPRLWILAPAWAANPGERPPPVSAAAAVVASRQAGQLVA